MPFIDDEDFPFTEEELRNALNAVYPADEAAKLVALVTSTEAPDEEQFPPEMPESLALPARDRGQRIVPPFIWAHLAASSPELERRCEEWRTRVRLSYRASRLRGIRHEDWAEMSSRFDAEAAAENKEWRDLLDRARIFGR